MKRQAPLLGVLAAGLAIRVLFLGRAPLWADEVHTLEAVSRPWGEMVRERLAAGHLPLYFVLEKAWCGFAGTGPFALRLPSALLGVALLVPARSLFLRLSGSPRVADAGALLLAVSPLFAGLSREARMYPLLGLAFLVLAEGAVRAGEDGRLPVRLVVAAALGPLVHATWAFPLAALALFVATEPGFTRPVRRRLLAVLAGSALLWLLAGSGADVPAGAMVRRPWPKEIGVFAIRLVAGEGVRESALLLYLALLAAAGVLVAAGVRRATARERRFALLLFVVPIAGPVAAGLLLGVPWGPVRYSHLAAAPLALMAARAAAR